MKYLFVFIAFVLFIDLAASPKQRLVLKNGNIVTLKSKGNRAQAIAIKDGNILAVGTDEQIQGYIGDDTKVIYPER